MKYIQPVGETDPNASYSNGNLSAGVEGSIVDARAIEHTMREIVNVITYSGLTPAEANLTQLRQAISTMIAAGAVALDTDGTMAANSNLVAPSQKAARTYIDAKVAALVAAAPGALDTLNELAAALGNDANYAATITAALGLKAPLASPDLTGNPTAPTQSGNDSSTRIATTAQVKASILDAFSNKNLAPSGYQVLPGGFLMQWAVGTVPAGGELTWTYPIAFPTACFRIFASTANSNSLLSTTTGPGLTSAPIFLRTAAGAAIGGAVNLLAIGN